MDEKGKRMGQERAFSQPEQADDTVLLGKEVLDECRTLLMMAFRFLDVALWRLPYEVFSGTLPLATDGVRLAFDPALVLIRYRASSDEAVRDYLHTLLHCVFRHPFDVEHPQEEAWSLACDAVVESIAVDVCAQRFPSDRDEERRKMAAVLKAQFGVLTPFKLYRTFEAILEHPGTASGQEPFDMDLLRRAQKLFCRDDHSLWAASSDESEGEESDEASDAGERSRGEDDAETSEQTSEMPRKDDESDADGGSTGEDPEDSGEGADGAASEDGDASGEEKSEGDEPEGDLDTGEGTSDSSDAGTDGAGEGTFSSGSTASEQQEWEEIGKKIETELASYRADRGGETESLVANLTLANRKVCNYADFLRQFSTIAEDIKINDDEFDYLFYTYGLKRYGNMPLIEPLEYQETHRVREFVIALDTSGSCSEDLLRMFVTRTYEILKSSEGFGDKVNVHIIQCDARVQSDVKITSVSDLESYRDGFDVRGRGGTDFRPVFDYVAELTAAGEFVDLRGLIYFTDGMGTYPTNRPPYDTAFVFLDEDATERRVPPWAMKVIIDEDRIRDL